MICACTETSSALTGSSHTINFGSTASARAMPMRWRCPPLNSCGYRCAYAGVQPDRLQQFHNPFLPRGCAFGQFMNVQRLADDLLHRHARIQRAVGVLKNHLELPPPRAQFRAAQFRDVLALEQNASRRRFDQPHDGAAERRLAATAFAHQPERFARRDAEAHIIHRLHEFLRG